jgi:hypothetical protein
MQIDWKWYGGSVAIDAIAIVPNTQSLDKLAFSVNAGSNPNILASQLAQSTHSLTVSDATTTFSVDLLPAEVTFSPAGGRYATAQTVTVNCTTAGATIYYTTDNSIPSPANGTPLVSGGTITVNRTMTIKAVAVVGGVSSNVVSQDYVIVTVVDSRTDRLDTTANSLVLQNGRVHLNANAYKHMVLSGTISNWTGDTLADYSGTWSYISLMGTDYFKNRQVPVNVEGTMDVFSYAGNANYGDDAKQRGFAANGGLVFWKGWEVFAIACSFGAEDCFPGPDGSAQNMPYNLLGNPTQCEFEIEYDLADMELTTKIKDIGAATWAGVASAKIGYRNNYTLQSGAAVNDDWSDVVMSVQTANSLAAGSYGFNYTINMAVADLVGGDANLDGKVDVSDLGILAANYGTTVGGTWSTGDFTNDGKVDVSDLGILAAHYGSGVSGSPDFATDAKVLRLPADDARPSAKADTPVSSTLGCGSAGLPLIAGLWFLSILSARLKEHES